MVQVEPHPDGAAFTVRAAPGSKKNGVTGEHNGMLKVSVTQIAEKGKANKALIDVLCKALRLRKSELELLSGHTSQEKRFLVRGATPEELSQRISNAIGG